MGISLLSLWLTLLWYPWPCSLKTKMFKSKSNLKHFINLLHFFLKNYFFCRKSISESADGPWLKSIFFYSNGFLFWLRKKIMEHLSVLADIYSRLHRENGRLPVCSRDRVRFHWWWHTTWLAGTVLQLFFSLSSSRK